MIIVGIDPGIARVGWGIISIQDSVSGLRILDVGCFETSKNDPLDQRLLSISTFLEELFAKYQPACVAVEQLYFAANAKTAIVVGQARGVLILTASQANIPLLITLRPSKTGNYGLRKSR